MKYNYLVTLRKSYDFDYFDRFLLKNISKTCLSFKKYNNLINMCFLILNKFL